ncbi:MAG: hypothetical protein ABT01_04555 [Clostridium sp. SCN 57-10]|nr:MAG: hypothetical protein ABT01_04555 [Clostridium sp. SCN 57-10]
MIVQQVSVTFGDKRVLSSFSADFSHGITCLRGASGGGKTTLLRVLAGLQKPDNGTVLQPFCRPAFMFQEDRLFPWLTAAQNVSAVLSAPNLREAAKWLAAVELNGEEDSYPGQLSGGMQRRVALARTLAYQGDALLLDEPFKGLDPPLVRRLIPLVTRQTVPVIIATHSDEEIALLGGRVIDL